MGCEIFRESSSPEFPEQGRVLPADPPAPDHESQAWYEDANWLRLHSSVTKREPLELQMVSSLSHASFSVSSLFEKVNRIFVSPPAW